MALSLFDPGCFYAALFGGGQKRYDGIAFDPPSFLSPTHCCKIDCIICCGVDYLNFVFGILLYGLSVGSSCRCNGCCSHAGQLLGITISYFDISFCWPVRFSPHRQSKSFAFILAVVLSFFLFSGFELLSDLFQSTTMSSFLLSLGISSHYESISRGLLDSRDLFYFLTISALFILLTRMALQWKRGSQVLRKNKLITYSGLVPRIGKPYSASCFSYRFYSRELGIPSHLPPSKFWSKLMII